MQHRNNRFEIFCWTIQGKILEIRIHKWISETFALKKELPNMIVFAIATERTSPRQRASHEKKRKEKNQKVPLKNPLKNKLKQAIDRSVNSEI